MSDILIVEADDPLRQLLRTTLVPTGHRLHEACTLAGARAVLERVSPDIVVIDDDLGGVSPMLWVEELSSGKPGISVVLLSDRSERDGAPLNSVLQWLAKPVSQAELTRVVTQRLGDASSGAPSSRQMRAVSAALADLRDEYRERLPERFSELERAMESARRAGARSAEFNHLRALVHRLRGSAGSFGLESVSLAAGRIEELLRSLAAQQLVEIEAWAAIARALEDAQALPLPAAPRVELVKAHGADLRILLVDDDASCRNVVSLMARAACLDVLVSGNTRDALHIAAHEHVDVVLLDLHLDAGDDAFRAIPELRRCARRADLPVAAFSADSSLSNRINAARAGADAFLVKPVNPEELSLVVRRLVDNNPHSRPGILVVDDDRAYAEALCRRLQAHGWYASTLTTPSRIFEALDDARPDLLLLAVQMPTSGLDICRVVRASSTWSELAIAFLTAVDSPEVQAECYAAGGDDCIRKPVSSEEVETRIGVRIARAKRFRRVAQEDALTGLLTRVPFSSVVTGKLGEAARHALPFSVAVLDLDRFKLVNDQHGHLAGDRVLRALGLLVASSFRAEDVCARWGGEEFVVAFCGSSKQAAAQALERALGDFREQVFEGDAGELFCCSFSAGVAQLGADGSTLPDLMQVADARLYAAKAAGRGRVVHLDRRAPAGLSVSATRPPPREALSGAAEPLGRSASGR